MADEPKTFTEAAQQLSDAEMALYTLILNEYLEPFLMPLCWRLVRGLEWLTKRLRQQ